MFMVKVFCLIEKLFSSLKDGKITEAEMVSIVGASFEAVAAVKGKSMTSEEGQAIAIALINIYKIFI